MDIFFLHYLVRVIICKRDMKLIDSYKKSGERKEKYSKLKIFEPED